MPFIKRGEFHSGSPCTTSSGRTLRLMTACVTDPLSAADQREHPRVASLAATVAAPRADSVKSVPQMILMRTSAGLKVSDWGNDPCLPGP
jgi:hypothetical protein